MRSSLRSILHRLLCRELPLYHPVGVSKHLLLWGLGVVESAYDETKLYVEHRSAALVWIRLRHLDQLQTTASLWLLTSPLRRILCTFLQFLHTLLPLSDPIHDPGSYHGELCPSVTCSGLASGQISSKSSKIQGCPSGAGSLSAVGRNPGVLHAALGISSVVFADVH